MDAGRIDRELHLAPEDIEPENLGAIVQAMMVIDELVKTGRRIEALLKAALEITKNAGRPAFSGLAPATRACTHLWTPREMQAVFEVHWRLVGCCHLSGL